MKQKLLLVLITVCIYTTTLSVPVITLINHAPLHPANNVAVTYYIRATSPTGLLKVTLEIIEHNIFANPDGSRGTSVRSDGRHGEVHSWTFPVTTREMFDSFTFHGFPSSTLVEYRFTAEDRDGSISRTVRMQAGTSPFGDREILLYSVGNVLPGNRFDICFIPDTKNYDDLTVFLRDLQTTIYRSYLSADMIRDHAEQWAFYYTPVHASSESKIIPAVLSGAPLDFFAFIHKNVFRDASSGNRFSTEYNMLGTIIHETGHTAFDLSDEYKGSSSAHESCNVFTSAKACRDANNNQNCRSFTRKDGKIRYTPDPLAPNCVMNNDGDAVLQQYGNRCQACIAEVYAGLFSQAHFAPFDNLVADSLFLTEKIIVVKIISAAGSWNAQVIKIASGTPTLNFTRNKDVVVDALDASGNIIYSVAIDDPRVFIIDDGMKNSSKIVNAQGVRDIHIPFDRRVEKIRIRGIAPGYKNVDRIMNVKNTILSL